MKNDTFFSDFSSEFEPKFQKEIKNLYENSFDTSFDPSLLTTFLDPVIPYVQTGKRIRPFLIAVGADKLDTKVIDAGIAFELLHTFILIHDDIMDGATMRRDVPTVHEVFNTQGIPGYAAAMLVGDFLFAACNEYMSKNVSELMPLFSKMQRFICVGQFYELVHWGQKIEPEVSKNIARFKSAQYSFMYPLQYGLQLAGKDIHMLDVYADAAGLGFQLRDDWLDLTGEMSGKDKGLDQKNSVPNLVQNALLSHNGDQDATKQEIQGLLTNHRQKGNHELENIDLSPQQKNSLSTLLTFSTSIS